MRYLLYLLWSIISLLVMVLVAATALLTVFNAELEQKLVEKIELNSGRNVEIQGGFGFKFNPRPTFFAKNIKMENAKWGSQPWMLQIESLQASLSFKGLFQGEITLADIKINRPRILIEKNARLDKTNWIFDSKREPKAFKKLAEHLRVRTARINDAQIHVEVGPIKHLIKVSVIDGRTNFFSKTISLHVLGSLHNKDVMLSAEIDSLRSILLRQPTQIRFEGQHGDTNLKGRGSLQDLMRWQGVDVKLWASIPDLIEIQPWMQTHLVETPSIEATANFRQPEKWSSARFDDISLVSDALDGQTTLAGNIRQIKNWNGIELKGRLAYPLKSIMHWKGRQSQTDAAIDASFSLSGNKHDNLAFTINSAEIAGTGITLHANGGIKHILQHNTEGILFTLHADSLAQLGAINAKKWFNSDAINGTFKLRRKDAKLAINEINLSAFDDRLKISGSLDDIVKQQIGRYSLSTKLLAKDIRRINELNAKKLSVFDQLEIKATIQSELNHFSAPESDATLISNGVRIHANGPVIDLVTLKVVDMPLDLRADSIEQFNTQFKLSLPELGALQATAKLNGDINKLFSFNDIKATITNPLQNITGQGDFNHFGPDMTAHLRLNADISSFDNTPALIGSKFKFPGAMQAKGSATLIADKIDDWSMKDIALKLSGENQGILTGSVVHFPKSAQYALIADISHVASSNISKLSVFNELKPENLSIYTELNKPADSDAFSMDNIDAQFSLAGGKGSVNVAGSVGDISSIEGMDLNIGLRTSDIKSMPFLSAIDFNPDMNGMGTVSIRGNPEYLTLKFTNIEIDTSDFSGTLMIENKRDTRPLIKGKIHSTRLDLIALLHQEKRKRLFSNQPLELEWLKLSDVQLSIKAEHLNGAIAQLTKANVDLTINNGVLNIPGLSGSVGSGRLTAWLTISTQSKPYSIVSTLKGETIQPEHINLFGKTELIRGGVIDIDIGLGGVGLSLADYMDNAYGKIQLQLRDSSLKNQKIELFGADLLFGILNVINPFTKQQDYLPIECGVIHFPVVKGDAVASQGIAIKTDKVTVLGGGGIDLGTEELQLLIKPKPRKGLGLSASTIASIAKISGSFGNPTISIDNSSFLESTAKIGLAIASGGWSLLAQGLLDRRTANSDVCNQTLASPNQKAILKRTQEEFDFDEEVDDR